MLHTKLSFNKNCYLSHPHWSMWKPKIKQLHRWWRARQDFRPRGLTTSSCHSFLVALFDNKLVPLLLRGFILPRYLYRFCLPPHCLLFSLSFLGTFFSPLFGHPVAFGVPRPGSDVSHSCDLHHSCSNSGFLTHCAGLGIEPASQRFRDPANPIVPQQGLWYLFFCFVLFCTCFSFF